MKKDKGVSATTVAEISPISLKMIEAINDYGSVKINEKAVLSVIKKAACKVPGVARLSPGTFVESIPTTICSTPNLPEVQLS